MSGSQTQHNESALAPSARPMVADSSALGVPRPSELEAALPRHIVQDALRRRALAVSDALAVLLAVAVADLGGLSASALFWPIALLPVWLVLAKLHGLYDRDHRALRHLTVDEVGSIVAWSTVSSAAAIPLLSLTPAGPPDPGAVVRMWIVLAVLASVCRAVTRILWRRWTPPAAALLIGSGPLERATRRKLELFRDIHHEVCGQLNVSELESTSSDFTLEHRLVSASGGTFPDRVVLCSHDVNEALLADLIRVCRRRRIKLSVVPPLRGMFGTAVRLSHVAELPLVEYHTWDVSASTITLKRCLDVIGALLLMVVCAPVLVVAAVAIAIDSGRPIFYIQRRAGFNGRPFRMIKFRTMVSDAEERLGEVVVLDSLPHPSFKLRDDPRITRVGRLLRRSSIDELPQLLNVLRGEMSLVGPRPEAVEFVDRYAPEHRFRLDATPGLTGPMQVFGRGDLDFDERLAIEREYIENVSIGRDLHILLLTIPAVVSGRGAF